MVETKWLALGGAAVAGVWILSQRGSAGGASGEEQCQRDIEAAQQAGDGGACASVVQMMACPHADVEYLARDGCEVTELSERGWEKTNFPNEPHGSPTAVTGGYR